MNVYIMTKAVPFGKEEYVGVAKTKKVAEKEFRKLFPHMRSSGNDTFISDKDNTFLLFIKEEPVKE